MKDGPRFTGFSGLGEDGGSSLKIEGAVGFVMNESFEKMHFAFLSERTAKTAWKRGYVGNSQEKEMAPFSWR
jgi:hypothetical protein